MAPSELAEIRALLIVQSETAEPRPQGLLGVVGALLKPRGDPQTTARPLNLSARPSTPTPSARKAPSPQERTNDVEPTLLLGEAIDPKLFAPLDLPPPPRTEFGVRSPRPYLPHDSVLLLNKRLPAQPRRLTLLTDAGEAVGEVYLTPDEAQVRPIYNAAHLGEEHQAPFFPGDLEEVEIQPRPLASVARPPAPSAPEPARPEPRLGQDLLLALALTLAREHEALCDRVVGAAMGAV